MDKTNLILGDCLVESAAIADGTADLILTDLPYGTIGDIENVDHGLSGKCGWDVVIDTNKVMEIADRILRKNGKMVLFAQQPFTTELITKSIPNLPFCYSMIWEKDHFANALTAKKAPLSYYEDILVFIKRAPKWDFEGLHPLRTYFKKVIDFIGLNLKQINATPGHRRDEHVFYVTPRQAIMKEIGQSADHVTRFGSSQFSLCTEKTYLELIEKFQIDKMEDFIIFKELRCIDSEYRAELLAEMKVKDHSTFNLWEGKKYKSNIFRYKKDFDGFHPTQKPVLLLEDLIKTFSNENDLVVDFTMGSGSTGVACKNTNRNFTGIEMNSEYFKIAENRIKCAEQGVHFKKGDNSTERTLFDLL